MPRLNNEKLYRIMDKSTLGAKKPRQEVITRFDRDIYYYNRDEVTRQDKAASAGATDRVTYEDHRRAINVAVNMFRKSASNEIAMCILTHRYFKDYRTKVFLGKGTFITDFQFIIKRVGMIFDDNTSRIIPANIKAKLEIFTKPTLVQINFIIGAVDVITPTSTKFTLAQWAERYNANAPESTKYIVAGIKIS